MFTGGFSDRYGYRVSLMAAYVINIIGYSLMAFTHTWGGFDGRLLPHRNGDRHLQAPFAWYLGSLR